MIKIESENNNKIKQEEIKQDQQEIINKEPEQENKEEQTKKPEQPEEQENKEKITEEKQEKTSVKKPKLKFKKPNFNKYKTKTINWFKNPKNTIYFIIFIVLFFWIFSTYSQYVFTDSIWLDETAHAWDAQLVKHNLMHVSNMGNLGTLFPVIIISIFNIFTTSFNAGRLMGLSLGLLGIIFTYLLGKEIKNEFVGLGAALLLGLHHWYRFLITKALLDVPLAAVMTISGYFLVKWFKSIDNNQHAIKNKWLLLLIISAICTTFSKFSGLFVWGFIGLSLILYFAVYNRKAIKQYLKIKYIIPVSVFLILIIVFLFTSNIGGFWLGISRHLVLKFVIPTYQVMGTFLGGMVITLLIIGTIIAFLYNKIKYLVIIIGGHLFLLLSAVAAPTQAVPELRYILPILPFFFILSMIALEEIKDFTLLFFKNKKYIKIALILLQILIVVLIVKPYYNTGNVIIEQKNNAYSGYIEAMDWVHENIPAENNNITGYTPQDYKYSKDYVSDLKIKNYFACCNYNVGLNKDDIRRVSRLTDFKTIEDFSQHLDEQNFDVVYINPDMWEPGQPTWANLRTWPFLLVINQETQQVMQQLDYTQFPQYQAITALGFKEVKVIKRPAQLPVIDINSQQRLGFQQIPDVPVNIIFKRVREIGEQAEENNNKLNLEDDIMKDETNKDETNLETEESSNRFALIETNLGNIKVELAEDKVPITTKNFIDLVEKGFYNNLVFHRVMKNFMIQGGDPNGDGTGGPDYTIKDEFHPDLKHDRGIISMANSGPNSGGSQFFITVVATPWLDNKHSVFGKIVEGLDIVDKISNVEVDSNSKPLEPVIIKSIKLVA